MRLIGHRGASAAAPENTIGSVRAALGAGAGFEVDLGILRSGEVVVLHDSTLRRTAAAQPWLWLTSPTYRAILDAPTTDLELDELRGVNVGSWLRPEPVPTFPQMLDELSRACAANAPAAHCYAELKADADVASSTCDAGLIAACEAAVRAAAIPPSRLTWISFSLSALVTLRSRGGRRARGSGCSPRRARPTRARRVQVELKRRMPEYEALLIGKVYSREQATDLARKCVDAGLDGIDVNADAGTVSAELVEWMHARNKKVGVWVWRAPAPNDNPDVWAAMADVGVDVFTSNLPPGALEWFGERASGARRSRGSG